MLSGFNTADLLCARISSAFKLGGKSIGEQETEFIAIPLSRSLRGRIDSGGAALTIVVVLDDASSPDDGIDSAWDDKDATKACRGDVFEDRFLGIVMLVFEVGEALVANLERVEGLVAIASFLFFHSSVGMSYLRVITSNVL